MVRCRLRHLAPCHHHNRLRLRLLLLRVPDLLLLSILIVLLLRLLLHRAAAVDAEYLHPTTAAAARRRKLHLRPQLCRLHLVHCLPRHLLLRLRCRRLPPEERRLCRQRRDVLLLLLPRLRRAVAEPPALPLGDQHFQVLCIPRGPPILEALLQRPRVVDLLIEHAARARRRSRALEAAPVAALLGRRHLARALVGGEKLLQRVGGGELSGVAFGARGGDAARDLGALHFGAGGGGALKVGGDWGLGGWGGGARLGGEW